MSSAKLLGAVIAISIVASSLAMSAQAPAAKPKPTKKPASAASQPKTPEPAPAPAPPPPSDVKIHTKYENGPQISENTTYMKGVRQRVEFPGVTVINQCDLKRTLQLHDASKHYMVVPADSSAGRSAAQAVAPPVEQPVAAQARAGAKPQGDVITETVTLTDTGERKQMFGLEARHITTRIVRQPGANACDARLTTVDTDGWYADLPERAACPSTPVPAAPAPASGEACVDRIETRQVGEAKLGVALSTIITTSVEDAPGRGAAPRGTASPDASATGTRATVSMSVTDLEITTLPAALFEVPAGYTEVTSYQALLPSLLAGGSLADAVFGSLADGTSAVAPKKPGVIRVGIVDPIDKSGRALPAPLLRGALIGSVSRGPFEALPVTGATAADLEHDAIAKEADFILVTEIAELKVSKAGKIGSVLRHVSGDANPTGDLYDARVDYKLYAIGDQARPRFAASAKASSGTAFGVGSALKVASFAGSMYVGAMSGGMLGFSPFGSPFGALGGSPFGGLGAFNALGHLGLAAPGVMASAGALAAGGMAGRSGGMSGGMLHPGMGAAMAVMSHGAQMAMAGAAIPGTKPGVPGIPGLADPSAQKAAQTVEDALSKAGKQIVEELGKSRRAS